jgi:hypothetical protein
MYFNKVPGAQPKYFRDVWTSPLSKPISCCIKAGRRAQTTIATTAPIYYQQHKLQSAKARLIDTRPDCTTAANNLYLSKPDMYSSK